MREEKSIKKVGVLKSGLILSDENGKIYNWYTKQVNHPLFHSNELMNVKMNVEQGHFGLIAKNVRISKPKKGVSEYASTC